MNISVARQVARAHVVFVRVQVNPNVGLISNGELGDLVSFGAGAGQSSEMKSGGRRRRSIGPRNIVHCTLKCQTETASFRRRRSACRSFRTWIVGAEDRIG